jgi:hypothetical protein
MMHDILTFYISDSLIQDLLKNLGVLKFLLNLGNDGISQLLLLSGLDLSLVSYPRVKNSLGFSSDGCLLFELESLRF